MAESKINDFILQKKKWIDKVIAANNKKLSENNSILNYSEIFVCGKRLPLSCSNKNLITTDAVYVKNIKSVKQVFVKNYSQQFLNYVNELSEQTRLHINSASIRSYKSRWGCCDRKGNLKFNFMLFMLPVDIQRYVIIHELCHTVHFNHSAEFWRLVESFVPNYKKLRGALKKYDYLTELY